MSTNTVILTDAQDAALATLVVRTNADRAAQTPALPPITATQYIQSRASEVAERYRLQLEAEGEARVLAAYKAANATKQNEIKTTLGI